MPGTGVSVFGVRHHGPGSARSLAAALQALEPDAVLIEGPPEAGPVLALALHEEMTPPVALLAYAPDDPGKAAFWPFAAFSPEWLAIRHALERDVTLRFIDIPAAHQLALGDRERGGVDPLGLLARAGGYDDPESWWEDVVEHRAEGPFEAVGEAMGALREEAGPAEGNEARREAFMRRAIRTALKEGHERVAVVCGAWHAPVLDPDTFPPAARDNEVIKGLPKVKVACTWVPWTHERLAFASGYGAGVTSPGWYAHLFAAPDHPIERWMQRVATLLRGEGLDASPASLVEAVRAADALAALRGRPFPGLPEVEDAALTVLCGGSDLALRLIDRRLVVGEVLGQVPEETPMVPLAEDVRRLQRSLRFKPEAAAGHKELDLRKPGDLARSRLLWRLRALDVPWGTPAYAQGQSRGTFKEAWRLEWQPELEVRLIEQSRWGTTVEAAAQARAVARAAETETLAGLTELVEVCLLAALPGAVGAVMTAFEARAAHDVDAGRLMEALGPLARMSRYGSVRQEPVESVDAAIEGLVPRICVGLAPATASLDDDAAAEMTRRIGTVHGALALLGRDDLRGPWLAALRTLIDRAGLHALVAGRACRLLHDAGTLPEGEAATRLSRALSRGADPAAGAAWLEGFLEGSGIVLVHDEALLSIVDGWLEHVPAAAFDELLPLLRRTFAEFPLGERRQIGSRLRRGGRSGGAAAADGEYDAERAAPAVATVAAILGLGAFSSGVGG
jgi:hypothetical protein